MTERMPATPVAECLQWGILCAQGETFTVQRVLGAAEALGLAAGLWGWLEDALVCATYAAEEGFEDDPEGLQTELDEFRYGRNLISAEETERWLAERRLSEDELVGALARERWRRRFEQQLPSLRTGYAPPPEALAGALWPSLVVHERLGPLAVALARRLVAPSLLPAHTRPQSPPPAALEEELPALRGCPAWARCTPEWRHRLRELEGAYQLVVRSLCARRSLETALAARQLDLTRFRILVARCGTVDAAREALLCIREDGEGFAAAAARAGAALEERELYLEQAPEVMAPRLVSAAPGESLLLEPAEQDGEPLLVHVLARSPASLDDPQVLERLQRALLARRFDPAVEEQVRWLLPME